MHGPTANHPRQTERSDPKAVFFTIIACNYLAQARVLMNSVAEAHPLARRVVVLVDRPNGRFDESKEAFDVIESAALNIPRSGWFHFKYSVLELATAVKPYAFEYLAEKMSARTVVYLDPDIIVYEPLTEVLDALEHANLVITPHLTAELASSGLPGELTILRAGAYNLGFLAVAMRPETVRFLRWWKDRLYDQCVVDLANGLFVDQKWIDLVPGMFEGVSVFRHPGYNVAYWNLPHRAVHKTGTQYLVNGQPLAFFHFSGFSPRSPKEISKHQNRLSMADIGDAAELFRNYAQRLERSGFAACQTWSYGSDHFANGLPIPNIGRPLLKEAQARADEIQDPFSDAGFNAILALWNVPIGLCADGPTGITRLAFHIYNCRPDVQDAMPDIFGYDRGRFLRWFVESGAREHGLFDAVLMPAVTAIEVSASNAEVPPPAEVAEEPQPSGQMEVSVDSISSQLLLSRPDVLAAFPPTAKDYNLYRLIWLSTHGKVEHQLHEDVSSSLARRVDREIAELPAVRRLALTVQRVGMRVAAARSRLLRPPGRPRLFEASALPQWTADPADPGVNLIGYLITQNGVGQSARNAVQALTAAGIPHRLENIRTPHLSEQDDSVELNESAKELGTNLYIVNADQAADVARTRPRKKRSQYHIATWVWELSTFPAEWDSAFLPYDEIWVPTSFCHAAIAARAPIPVVKIPYVVTLPQTSSLKRADFGIRPDSFVFLCIFDMRSVFARKNPLAVIQAFRQAFPVRQSVELIIKVNHADYDRTNLELLRTAAAGAGIRLIEETWPHADVAALIHACDAVVSLHRSEGFGLVLAEAMLLGKPVIATNYSGNADFTTPFNSFLVDYRLTAVGKGADPYDPTCQWADPSVPDAARQMRVVKENKTLRKSRAQAGKEFIHQHFSPTAIGESMARRLECIALKRRMGNLPVPS
ncbi:MAG: glycosyltransferase [Acidobacteria bacterium]|nr:glycosyltransferase [Acidobacteriota bacterium]